MYIMCVNRFFFIWWYLSFFFSFFFFFFCFCFSLLVCTMQPGGIIVHQPGIKPVSPAMEAPSLNHWTAREVPDNTFLNLSKSIKHHLLNNMHFAIWINHDFPYLCLAVSVASVMSDSTTLRTVACQVPLSMARILAVGCHFLLQGIFSTQGLNHHLLYCSWIVYHWATLGLDIKLFWNEGKE